jgi:FMN phosphatase YigB (HAD superfamily)
VDVAPAGGWAGHAITFDLWYTLIFQSPAERIRYIRNCRAVWRRQFARAGGSPARFGRIFPRLLAERRSEEAEGRSWSTDRQVAWLNLKTGLRLDAQSVEAGIGRALSAAVIRTVPGAQGVLEYLGRSGCALGLVSNTYHEGTKATRDLLQRLGLERHFQSIVLSSDFEQAKPSPEPIRRCLAELAVPPSRAVHVGDLPSDVRAAQAAGAGGLLFFGTDSVGPTRDRVARRPFRGAAKSIRRLEEVPARAAALLDSTDPDAR